MDEQRTAPGVTGPRAPSVEETAVPTERVSATGVTLHRVEAPRSRRLRWGIAGAIVVMVALVTTAGAFVLSGAAGAKSLTASMAPKDSVVFMEVRTDLPGDQRTNLKSFMSYFPGFKDQSQFDNALDQLLNQLTSAVSPDLTYTSAFKPWMEGEVSIAVENFGTTGSATSATCSNVRSSPGGMLGMGGMMPLHIPSAVAIFALKDRAAAASWVGGELTRLHVTAASETYASATLYTLGDGHGAYALTAQDLVLGSVEGVKAALDTTTNGSLADDSNYQDAMKAVSADSLARFYADPRALLARGTDAYVSALCAMPGVVAASLPPVQTSDMPAWVAGMVRAESDHLVVETDVPRTAGTPSNGNHASRIATSLPASTVAAFEMHSVGQGLSRGISALESAAPSAGIGSGQIGSLQNALFLIGGVDWIGDGTAVVTKDGSGFGGGVVLEAPDASTARSKLGNITGLVGLSGIATGIKSRTESYKGSTITVITVPASFAGKDVDLAVTTKDNLVVAGYTDAFAKAVLDATPGNSLASQPGYSTAMGAAGASGEASAYVDMPALEDTFGLAALEHDAQRWTQDYKPYFDHLGRIAFVVVDGSTITTRFVVTAR